MSELRDLYQEVILDHNKRPRNFGALDDANRHADGHNPLCGDQISIYLKLNGDIIEDIRFEGQGCAISKASASMMTAELKGKTLAGSGKHLRRVSRNGRRPGGIGRRRSRSVGQIGGVFRRPRIPRPREMRQPRLAHPSRRPGKSRAAGDDGVGIRYSVFGIRKFRCYIFFHTRKIRMCNAVPNTEYRIPNTRSALWNYPQLKKPYWKARLLRRSATVYDPEIPVNVYDLGLIYNIDISSQADVHIQMTLTSPGCPVAGTLPPEVEEKAESVPGVREASVEIVWEPQWNMDMMTDEAKLDLGLF